MRDRIPIARELAHLRLFFVEAGVRPACRATRSSSSRHAAAVRRSRDPHGAQL